MPNSVLAREDEAEDTRLKEPRVFPHQGGEELCVQTFTQLVVINNQKFT